MSKGVSLGTSAVKEFIVGKVRGTYSEGSDDDALVARIMASSTGGRIHGSPVPDEYEYPFTTFARYGGSDNATPLGRDRPTTATTVVMQVKTVCEGYDETPIEETAACVDELLNGRTGIVDLGNYGTFQVECSRESELLLDLPPDDDGTVYQQIGGIYEFLVTRVG